jgi:hypothetical protein
VKRRVVPFQNKSITLVHFWLYAVVHTGPELKTKPNCQIVLEIGQDANQDGDYDFA